MNSQSLEYIVNTHFPLIKDKFNFSKGTLKGVSFVYRSNYMTPAILLFGAKNTSTTYMTKEAALEKYLAIIKEHLSEYINNIYLEMLYNKLIESVIPKIEKSLENRKKAIDKLCEFKYARYRIANKYEFVKLFDDDNQICQITYLANDKNKTKPRYGLTKNKNRSIAITHVNIPAIMEDIETNLIINEEQKRVILEQLNFLVGPTDGYDEPTKENILPVTISQDLLQSIEDELERALNKQVKDKRINWKLLPELTTQEKWEHYGDHETYQTWLRVHTIRNKK